MAAAALLELLSAVAVRDGGHRAANAPLEPPPLPTHTCPAATLPNNERRRLTAGEGALKLKNESESGVSVPAARHGAHCTLGALAGQTQWRLRFNSQQKFGGAE